MVKNQCLEIKIGDEYLSKVESVENFEESFFSEVYLKAFKSVEEIVKNNTEKKEALEFEDYSEEKEEEFIDYENYNNIIAFTGERGTGKTSAMLSVSKALKFKNFKKNKESIFMKKNKNFNLDEYKFLGLKVIDPSHFQENRNIIEIILAKMFQKFKESVENCNNENTGDKREVIKCFEEVYKNLKSISKKDVIGDEEAIDTLLKMSASSDLKGNLEKLIESYLDFMAENKKENKRYEQNKGKNKVLLLEIDDLDLNTKYAYEMIEQIRKYLIIKNVVILMAVKIEQLSLVIERNTRKEFKELIKAGQIGDEKINIMSDKYLRKLIPLERRLYMPDLEIESENKKIKIIKKHEDRDSEEEIIDKKIRSLIYNKTGMEFIDGKYIVPNNLRDLINIISLLEKMPDLTEEEKEKKTMTNNFLLWKDYIFEIWTKKYLSIKQHEILEELYKRDIEEKNKYTVNEIENFYSLLKKDDKFKERRKVGGKEEYTDLEKEYQDIINLNNNPKNICLGDVLFVLDKAKKYKIGIQDQRFIYAIKMVYSIMLSEIYEASEDKLEETFGDLNDYQKLLCGYLYHSKIKKFIKDLYTDLKESKDLNIESKDRRYIYVKEVKNFNKLLKGIDINAISFFEKFRVKVNNLYKNEDFRGEKRQEEDLVSGKISIEALNDNDKIEFDILGFLFNIEKGDFYIRNIEILEKIISRNYKANDSNYLKQLKEFFKEYKEGIDLDLNDKDGNKEEIKLYKEGFSIKEIEEFIEDIEKNKILRDEFNYLFFYKDNKEIKERSKAKEEFKKDMMNFFNGNINTNIGNSNNFSEAIDKKLREFLVENKKGYEIRFNNIYNDFLILKKLKEEELNNACKENKEIKNKKVEEDKNMQEYKQGLENIKLEIKNKEKQQQELESLEIKLDNLIEEKEEEETRQYQSHFNIKKIMDILKLSKEKISKLKERKEFSEKKLKLIEINFYKLTENKRKLKIEQDNENEKKLKNINMLRDIRLKSNELKLRSQENEEYFESIKRDSYRLEKDKRKQLDERDINLKLEKLGLEKRELEKEGNLNFNYIKRIDGMLETKEEDLNSLKIEKNEIKKRLSLIEKEIFNLTEEEGKKEVEQFKEYGNISKTASILENIKEKIEYLKMRLKKEEKIKIDREVKLLKDSIENKEKELDKIEDKVKKIKKNIIEKEQKIIQELRKIFEKSLKE